MLCGVPELRNIVLYLLTILLFSRPSAIFTYETTLVPMIPKYHSCKYEYHTLANTQCYVSGLFAVLPHWETSKWIAVLLQWPLGWFYSKENPKPQYLAGLAVWMERQTFFFFCFSDGCLDMILNGVLMRCLFRVRLLSFHGRNEHFLLWSLPQWIFFLSDG